MACLLLRDSEGLSFQRKATTTMGNFWEGKVPCWVLLDCSNYVYPTCPAYQNPEMPCWEHETTRSKRLLGIDMNCEDCRVFKIYQAGQAGAPKKTQVKEPQQKDLNKKGG